MIRDMARIAAECVKEPGKASIWSAERGEYVCVTSEEGHILLIRLKDGTARPTPTHPPISPQFKLVFLTAAIGTLFFVVLCLVLTLIAGKEPPRNHRPYSRK